jgi:hypothetical protein
MHNIASSAHMPFCNIGRIIRKLDSIVGDITDVCKGLHEL